MKLVDNAGHRRKAHHKATCHFLQRGSAMQGRPGLGRLFFNQHYKAAICYPHGHANTVKGSLVQRVGNPLLNKKKALCHLICQQRLGCHPVCTADAKNMMELVMINLKRLAFQNAAFVSVNANRTSNAFRQANAGHHEIAAFGGPAPH